ncbi:MAG: hypothetical protein R2940_07350 [Syntrophotaleaceae bacterium]
MNRIILGILVSIVISGCGAANPPVTKRLTDSIYSNSEQNTILLIDVCIKKEPAVTDDYYVVKNSQDGAKALSISASNHLTAVGFDIKDIIVPFVCGAIQNATPARVAYTMDDDVTEIALPYVIDNNISKDTEYALALKDLVRFITQEKLLPEPIGNESKQISLERAKIASSIVTSRSNNKKLVYIWVGGNSLSGGKAAAYGTAQFLTGLTTGILTGFGTNLVAVYVFPKVPSDGMNMFAGILDLRNGEILNMSTVFAKGDPMNPEVVARGDNVRLLLNNFKNN